MRRLAVTALVLALLAGTTAAFGITQALKLERSPITAPNFDRVFSPTCECARSEASLALRLRKGDRVDAAIVDRDGQPVRVLAEGAERRRGVVRFTWDGRDDAGRLVPDGRYRLRIHLAGQRRTIVVPNPVNIDTKAPTVELVSVRPRTFSPDGDRRNERVVVFYRSDELSSALVFVDGDVTERGRTRPAGRRPVVWDGRIAGQAGRAGVHHVFVRARDRAGNLSRATAPVSVRIRYIELARKLLRARRGGLLRFGVLTDARGFRWSLRSSRGGVVAAGRSRRRAVVVRLPLVAGRGRYTLRVSANGHDDRAMVIVLRRPA